MEKNIKKLEKIMITTAAYLDNLIRVFKKVRRSAVRYVKGNKQKVGLAGTAALLAVLISFSAYKYLTTPHAPNIREAKEGYIYNAKGLDYKAYIGNKNSNRPEVNFAVGEGSVTFTPVSGNSAPEKPVKDGKKAVLFKNVYSGINFRYETLPLGVKEEIIIEKPTPIRTFPFFLDFKGTSPQFAMNTENGMAFFDNNKQYLFHFEKPFAVDAKGVRTDDIGLLIRKDKTTERYVAILTLDKKWMADGSRAYPITVDPTVLHDTSAEFSTGSFDRIEDTGTGSNPSLETYYQELATDSHTVALWHIDETSENSCSGGEDMCDSSGIGNHGTATGTTIETTNQRLGGAARNLNGSSDYIYSPTSMHIPTKDFTYEAWINPDTTNDEMIFMASDGTGINEFYVFLTATDKLSVVVNTAVVLTTATSISTSSWQHIAVTRSGSRITAYINGAADPNTGTDSVEMNFGSCGLIIGADADSACNGTLGNWFDGIIDEIRVSNIARSPEEIKLAAQRRPYGVYTSPVIDLGSKTVITWDAFSWNELGVTTGDGETPEDSTSLVAQWNFNETSGTTANNDAEGTSCGGTPANCDGTLTNFDSTASQDADPDSTWTSNNRRWGAGAVNLDGTDSYVSCSDATCGGTSRLDIGTNNWSVSGWIKTEKLTRQLIAGKGSATGQFSYALETGLDSTGEPDFFLFNTADGTYMRANGTKSIADGLWHYIVGTYDGTTIRIYIDGVLNSSSTSKTGTQVTDSTSSFEIGARTAGSSMQFRGVIDTVAVFSRALTSAEIVSNFNAANVDVQTRVGADTSPDDTSWENWSPAGSELTIDNFETSDSSLVSYWPMSEVSGANVQDTIGANEGTATGTMIVDGHLGKARHFEGTTSYVNIPDNATLDITGNFTAMAWVKRTNAGFNGYILSKFSTTGSGGYALLHGNLGEVYCRTDNGSSFVDSYTDTGFVTESTGWVHVAIARTGSSCRVFIDGVDQTDTTATHTTLAANNLPVKIGTNADASSDPYTGYIQHARLFDAALTADQIKKYMGESPTKVMEFSGDTVTKIESTESTKITTGNTEPDTNTVGLWHLDETGGSGAYIKDYTTTASNGTPTGTALVKGVNRNARNFNGSSDYIRVGAAASSELDFDSNGITLEAWIKPDSVTGEQHIISRGTRGVEGYGMNINFSAGLVNLGAHGGSNFSGTTVLSPGNWYHVVGVINGTASALYVNGRVDAIGTVNVVASDLDLRIGSSWNGSAEQYFFDGVIDEVRISNVARTPEEVAEAYRLGRDHYLSRTISATDLSGKNMVPFYVAADRPGTYLEATAGETDYANNLEDANTKALYTFDDNGSKIWNDIFPGDTIDSGKWLEVDPANDKISVNDGLVLSAGTAAAWDSGVISRQAFDNLAGNEIYAVFTTGGSVAAPNHMMIGWGQDQTASGSYTVITHALYFNAGAFYVYQNGVLFGGPYGSGYAANTTYEVMITINAGGTASYKVRGGAYTSWTTLLAADNTSAFTRFRAQVANYRHTGTFEEIRVTSPMTADVSGNNLPASIDGGSFSQGKNGYGRTLSADTDKMMTQSTSILDTDTHTIDFWLRFNQTTDATYRTIFAYRPTGTDRSPGIWDNPTNHCLHWRYDPGNTGTASCAGPGGENTYFTNGVWYHIAGTKSGSTFNLYVNGILVESGTVVATKTAGSAPLEFGQTSFNAAYVTLDNFRISNVARTAEEIRQTYEMGERSHSVTIDFAAKLDSGNLIADTNDLSFTVDATYYGLEDMGSKLFAGDKIIVRENYDGTEYIAQGTVTGITASSGATTIASWDSGSTFPSGGFTANADVFKWQREYWNITGPIDSQLNAVTNIKFRVTNGDEARTIWLDDLRSNTDYLTTPGGSTITSSTGFRYFQYRLIETSNDTAVSATVSAVTTTYTNDTPPDTPTLDAPSDGAVSQSATPVLQTTASDDQSDNIQYKIEICTDLAMTTACQTFDQSVSQTGWSGQNADTGTTYTSGTQGTYTVQAALQNGTTYYWRSYAIDPAGTNTFGATQGTPFSFTTTAAPGAPTDPLTEGLTNPTAIADLTPEFSAIHNDADGDSANYYEIEVNTASNFGGTVMWDTGQVSMTVTADGVRSPDISYAGTSLTYNGATYYWRIRFWDTVGQVGAWSTTQNFTTNSLPATPTLDSPTNGATGQSVVPALKTTTTDGNSDYLRYRIQLCENSGMTVNCQTFDQTSSQTGWSGQDAETGTAYASGTQATYTVQSSLSTNTTYYWRSYAIDPGGSNTWSATQGAPFSFTTTNAPAKPTACVLQKAPDDSSVTITWNDIATNEDGYRVERDTDGGGFSLLQSLPADSESHEDSTVTSGHTYQYRVAAFFTDGPVYSDWCTTATIDMGSGTFNFDGLNMQGVTLD